MREHKLKSPAIVHRLLAIVVAERLLIQITEEMKWFHAHIGALESAFEQAPEVLHPVGVDFSVHISNRVVNHLVPILFFKTVIGEHGIGEEIGAFRDVLADLWLNVHLAGSRDNFGPNFAATLQCSPNRLLSLRAGAGDATLSARQVHVDCLATDISLIGLYFASLAAKFPERIVLHRKTDAVHHEP